MADENLNKEVVETPVQTQLFEVNPLDALGSLPGVTAEDITSISSKAGFPPTPIQVETPVETQTEVEVTPEVKTEVVNTPVTPVAVEKIDNPFVTDDVTPIVEKQYTDFTEVAKELSNKTGIEIKEYKDALSLADKFIETKTLLDERSKEANEYKSYATLLEGMPEDLYKMVEAYSEGKNYRELAVSNKPLIDFTKPFDSQDKESIIKYYAPDKLQDEDYLLDEDAVNRDLPLIKSLYQKDQESWKITREQRATQEQRYREQFNRSAEEAYSYLNTSTLLKVGDNHRKDVASVLQGGKEAILSMFLNEDGTYKKDAAEKILLHKYGTQAIEYHKKLTANRVETKVLEEIVTRANDTPSKTNVGGQQQGLTEQQAELIKMINEQLPTRSDNKSPF